MNNIFVFLRGKLQEQHALVQKNNMECSPIINMVHCKTVISPLLTHRGYCILALNHNYVFPIKFNTLIIDRNLRYPTHMFLFSAFDFSVCLHSNSIYGTFMKIRKTGVCNLVRLQMSNSFYSALTHPTTYGGAESRFDKKGSGSILVWRLTLPKPPTFYRLLTVTLSGCVVVQI